MNFNDPISMLLLLAASCFLLLGLFMIMFPSKKIDSFFGYRSKRSKFNKRKWDFAQHYSSRRMIESGFLTLGLSFGSQFVDIQLPLWSQMLIVGFTLLFTVANVFLRTEFHLKRVR